LGPDATTVVNELIQTVMKVDLVGMEVADLEGKEVDLQENLITITGDTVSVHLVRYIPVSPEISS
jgi:hypothetical protein